jgi:hypothetical protein
MAEMIGKSVLRSKDTTVLLCWPVVFGVLAAAATGDAVAKNPRSL